MAIPDIRPRTQISVAPSSIVDKPMDLGGRLLSVKANNIALNKLFATDASRGGRTVYTYDFGDRWEHEIELIGRKNNVTNFAVCIDGEGHPAQEDIGGPSGWGELQRAHLPPVAVGLEERAEQEDRIAQYKDLCGTDNIMGQMGLRVDGF